VGVRVGADAAGVLPISQIFTSHFSGAIPVRSFLKAIIRQRISSRTWSPDGTGIAFASNRGDLFYFEIHSMNVDGGAPLRLTNKPAVENEPCWAPDGVRVVFSNGVAREEASSPRRWARCDETSSSMPVLYCPFLTGL
jgi:dipeptidyl aminopeptidase/acylaminoacyl peptidase